MDLAIPQRYAYASPDYTAAAVFLCVNQAQQMRMVYLNTLKDLRKKRGWSQAKLAEMVGVEQPTVQRWESGKRAPDLEGLENLAKALGVTPGSLLDGTSAVELGPRLFVKGDVAAGVWRAAVERDADEWESFTGRPDVTASAEHRFGLRIIGDSMNEVFPPGTIVECVSTFGNAEARPGKRVVIVRENDAGAFEATVKELVEQDGKLYAVPRSTNPIHRPIDLAKREPGIKETRITAIVVASIRPE